MNELRGDWLTKTDFMNFCRCPYAHSMYEAGLIPPSGEEHEGEEHEEAGNVFFPKGFRRLFRRKRWRLITDKNDMYRNTALMIAGRPDGIDCGGGAMVPIEVMIRMPSFGGDGEIEHRPPKIRPLHRWGLAFYWLVLSPYRTGQDTPPLGRVVFEIGKFGSGKLGLEARDLPLADDLAAVEFAIEKARQAKTSLSPHSCGRCDVCKTRFAHRLQLATEQRSLALVTPISFRQALDLERVGIVAVEDLVSADGRAISRAARVSEKRAEAWKRAASAAVAGSPVILRKPEVLPDHANMIALDTEYGEFQTSSWVIGIRVVRRGACEDHILWASFNDGCYKALRRTAKLFRDHRDLPIVTWNGRADLERIADAAERWAAVGTKIGIDRDDIARRHIDMLKVVRGSLALPIPKLRLKEVAQYFGVPADPVKARLKRAPGMLRPHVIGVDAEGFPELAIADGRDAQEAIYLSDRFSMVDVVGIYVEGGDLRRKPPADYLAARRAVEEYLRQDLRLTTEVTRRVGELLRTPAGRSGMRSRKATRH